MWYKQNVPSVQTKPTHTSKPGKRDPVAAGERDATQNRAASHNYYLSDKLETGLVLRGTEVKSVRAGLANLKDAYALVKNGELWLLNAHIGPMSTATSSIMLRCGRGSCSRARTRSASWRPRASKKDSRLSPPGSTSRMAV